MIRKIKISGYRIYKRFVQEPNSSLNLIVGANEAGKSTLLEALALALTGRINARSAQEELNPYWFNVDLVAEFLERTRAGKPSALPEIRIELFLNNCAALQQLCGAVNTDLPTIACPGVSLRVHPNPEYAKELDEWTKDPCALLPVEYYLVDWRSFADEKLTMRPKSLVTAIIDSQTVRSSSGVDYHLRQLLNDHLEPNERAAISLAYRRVKSTMSTSALKGVNSRLEAANSALHDRPITLAMDQSSRTSWEGVVTPHVSEVPFSMAGQGQQAAIKIALAMQRQSTHANIVLIEEPENHLTHTTLTTLLDRIEKLAHKEQQLFVSTHSSFVLNRLGLDRLMLIGNGDSHGFSELAPETVSYFKRLPGYDTLRLVLASKIVLVEGPSDEIIFERIFHDLYGTRPMACGIDVLSMRGLSLARCLELCAALGKHVAALRDNDGVDPTVHAGALSEWLHSGRRHLFIGAVQEGPTLEPQLIYHNGESALRHILGISDSADLSKWMSREKTEAALRIAEATESVVPPPYLRAAAAFIHG